MASLNLSTCSCLEEIPLSFCNTSVWEWAEGLSDLTYRHRFSIASSWFLNSLFCVWKNSCRRGVEASDRVRAGAGQLFSPAVPLTAGQPPAAQVRFWRAARCLVAAFCGRNRRGGSSREGVLGQPLSADPLWAFPFRGGERYVRSFA